MEMMHLPANFKIDEAYIPPRCRKPRYREYKGTTTVSIPVVKPEEAPVAMSHMEGIRHTDNYYRMDYRWYNGQLYVRKRDFYGAKNLGFVSYAKFRKAVRETFQYHEVRDENYCFIHEVDKAKECIQANYSNILIIENGKELQVWEVKGEPRYYVITFGLGYNHGGIGTWLSIGNYYNGNIGKERYFNALQYQEAQKEALRIAKARGDDKSYPYIRRAPKIRVFIPEAVQCNPAVEAGDGDPFQNKLEAICEGAGSALTAGLMVMGTVMSEL